MKILSLLAVLKCLLAGLLSPQERAILQNLIKQDVDKRSLHLAIGCVADYLGYVMLGGMLAVRAAVRSTQMTRAQVKEKLKAIKG